MRICVFGAGSLGSAAGGMLAEQHEVALIGRAANVQAIRRNGLEIRGAVEKRASVSAHSTIRDLEPPELLIVATKAYNTRAVIETCRDWLTGDTRVLTLQNGLGNLELLREWLGPLSLGGTTTMGAVLLNPGIVRIAGVGRTVIGGDMDSKSARSVASLFKEAGMPSSVAKDIYGEIWAKAIVNAAINPLTAVLGVTNGALLESRTVTRLMSEICSECEAVAEAAGIALPTSSLYRRAREVARVTGSNRSSMLRDIELGRKTEISCINGHIYRMASELKLRAPLNKALVAIVESLESRPIEKG